MSNLFFSFFVDNSLNLLSLIQELNDSVTSTDPLNSINQSHNFIKLNLFLNIKKALFRVHYSQLERVKRIELSQSAWKAEVLPLNYTRIGFRPSNVLLSHLRTTLGAKELNFCVRYGNRCALLAIVTRPFGDVVNLPKLDIFFSFFG